MGFVITVIIIVIIAGLISIAVKSGSENTPEEIGKVGEADVSDMAEVRMIEGDQLINDVIIPGKDGRTSQIDHVLISTRGVIVIETKAYSGRIYGSYGQKYWTQVLAYGKEKHKFYSPVLQNETHIRRLKQLLSDFNAPFYNVVVFTKAEIDSVDCENVYTLRGLSKFLKSLPTYTISIDEVEKITSLIRYYKDNPIETNEEHAAKIQATNKKVEEGHCPRCGAELVLRKSKDGSFFYGCSNYPRCKYTKTLNK